MTSRPEGAAPLPVLATMAEVMTCLGVGRAGVKALIDRGELRAVKVCRQYRFEPAAVAELLERRRVPARAA